MDSSSFNDLPAEPRNRIYALALHHGSPKSFAQLVFAPRWRFQSAEPTHDQVRVEPQQTQRRPAHPLALTQVRRQMHDETEGIFYAVNRFIFPITLPESVLSGQSGLIAPDMAVDSVRGTGVLRKWLEQHTPEMMPAIGDITLDAGRWECWTKTRFHGREIKDMAKNLQDISDNLAFLIRIGVSVSVRLEIDRVTHTGNARVRFCLPVHDQEALRTVIAETMEPHFTKKPATQAPSSTRWFHQRSALGGCRDIMDGVVKPLLKDS